MGIKRHLRVGVRLFAVLTVLVIKLTGTVAAAPAGPPLGGTMERFVASDPPLPAPTTPFISGQGTTIKLIDFQDRLLLINFWASWCAPCIRELASLSKLRDAIPDQELEILLVSIDRHGKPGRHASFLADLAITNLASASDPRANLLRAFKAPGIPVTILIGRDGRVIGRLLGDAEWNAPEAVALIRHYLEAD